MSMARRAKIRSRLQKMQDVNFTRFDLGHPSTLDPVHRADYLQPNVLAYLSAKMGPIGSRLHRSR